MLSLCLHRPLDYLRHFGQTTRPAERGFSVQPRNPMRIASDIVAALNAATDRFNQPTGWQPVDVRPYLGCSMSIDRAEPSSMNSPE
jgi:hypothetical protein